MKFGIPISFTLHALVLSGGIFLYRSPPLLPPDRLIVPIDIISVADETNIKATVKRPETKPEPDEIETPTAEAPLENAPESAPENTASDVQTLPETLPEPAQDAAEETAEAVPDEEVSDAPPAEDAPSFSLDDLSALVDKSRDSQPEANQQKVLQSEETLYAFADVARQGAGAGDGLALSETDALRAAMYKCWRIPKDAKDPESLIVLVEVKLHRDGHVASVQLKTSARINSSSNPYLKVAAENALRAVSKCAPYEFLPAERYDVWKQMTLTFRPILSQ